MATESSSLTPTHAVAAWFARLIQCAGRHQQWPRIGAVGLCLLSFAAAVEAQSPTADFSPCSGGAEANCIFLKTEGDSATPSELPRPVVLRGRGQLLIWVGPLSPLESCSLTATTVTPATSTSSAALGQLIGTLLSSGASLAGAVSETAGAGGQPLSEYGPFGFIFRGLRLPSAKRPAKTPGEVQGGKQLDVAETQLEVAQGIVDGWVARRAAALGSLEEQQALLLSVAAGRADASSIGELKNLSDCLDEEGEACGKRTKVSAARKSKAEQKMQMAAAHLTLAATLINPGSHPGASEIARLGDDQAWFAEMQNADTTLRGQEAALKAVAAQALQVEKHVASVKELSRAAGLTQHLGRYEPMITTEAKDSDVSAAVSCANILTNTVSFGPVPIAVHWGVPKLLFSAGALFGFTPYQTFNETPEVEAGAVGGGASTPATSLQTVVTASRQRVQTIPFAFFTAPVKWFSPSYSAGLGVTGGVGFNPNSGVQGADFFAGGSVLLLQHVLLHVGAHLGRFQELDSRSNIQLDVTQLPSGFPTSVPTRTRWTAHFAVGISYAF